MSPVEKAADKVIEKPNLNINVDVSGAKETLLNFIVPLVCFILVGVLGGFILYPTMKNMPNVKKELSEKETLEAQLTAKKVLLNKLLDFKSVVSEHAQFFDKVLVSEAMVPELLTQVSQIAHEAGFEITKLTYSLGEGNSSAEEETVKSLYDTVTVSLSVTGTYDQLITFLTNVENAARLISIENFRYSGGSSGEDNTLLDITFVLTSPYLYVESSAVTDDPVTLDVTDPAFVDMLNRVKALRWYDISKEEVIPVVEETPPAEPESGESETPAEPEIPAEEQPIVEE